MIKNIQIRNFKSIRMCNVHLKSLNILIGANGAGKSNFIGSFKMLNKIYRQELRTYVAEQGGVNNLLYFGRKKSPELGFKIFFDNINYYAIKLTLNTRDAFFFAWENDGFNRNNKSVNKEPSWHTERSRGWTFGKFNERANGCEIPKYLNSYLDSFKIYHFHDTSSSAKVKAPSQVADNRFLREDGANLAAFLYHLQKVPNEF
ncbi:MAG: AAA family ATPase [Arcicella sp.]|nr:AAA family ATPase [Arcicella sp.]